MYANWFGMNIALCKACAKWIGMDWNGFQSALVLILHYAKHVPNGLELIWNWFQIGIIIALCKACAKWIGMDSKWIPNMWQAYCI